MEIKLLQLLSQHNALSIGQLSQALELNTLQTLAIIARINKLKAGSVISYGSNYTLSYPLNWLNQNKIEELLQAQKLDYQVHLLSQTDSTNSYALKHINQLANKTIVSCDWQYAGRGRFGRHWLSSIAHDLTVSIIYDFPADFNLQLLPLLCAVAVNRLLKNYRISNQIKWPNDIYQAKSKLKISGILVENIFRDQINHSVIGIGIDNLANWERNQLLVDLVASLDNLINEFKLFGFALLRREWLDNCLHLKHNVKILQHGEIIARGIHSDIGEHGELIVQTATGTQKFSSSAISLRLD